jgi:hypothetical protein
MGKLEEFGKTPCTEGYNVTKVNEHFVSVCAWAGETEKADYNRRIQELVAQTGSPIIKTDGICEAHDKLMREDMKDTVTKWAEARERVAKQQENKIAIFPIRTGLHVQKE